jgi:hypothetical protein
MVFSAILAAILRGAQERAPQDDAWIVATSLAPSLRGANGSRERAPDDRLRDEAIQSFFEVLDCFAESVIGRAFRPIRWLAMTNGLRILLA